MSTYLITGGSGSLGRSFAEAALTWPGTVRVILLARGEHRLAEVVRELNDPRVEGRIGDVRDRDRLRWLFGSRPDVIVHAAAIKRVESCERDPDEARKTNVLGTENVVKEAMLADVPKVLVISSDKACIPELVYGHTKAEAENVAIYQNAYRGRHQTRISVVRYGNCVDSQGSVWGLFAERRQTRQDVPITDLAMTRFVWNVRHATTFVRETLQMMRGAEIWVPRLKSVNVAEAARLIAPECAQRIIGVRGKEKLHETMIGAVEARHTWELPDRFVILPAHGEWWSPEPPEGSRKVPDGFLFSSDQAPLPAHEVIEIGVAAS